MSMNKDTWKTISSICMVFVTLLFILATWFAADMNRTNARKIQESSFAHEREMKSIEFLIHFQARWDKVAYDIKGKVLELNNKAIKVDPILVNSYYNRYWDLQLEQYQVWTKGLLDDLVYSSWMDYRKASG